MFTDTLWATNRTRAKLYNFWPHSLLPSVHQSYENAHSYNASEECIINMNDIPRMGTRALLAGAKPQTFASVLICTEPAT